MTDSITTTLLLGGILAITIANLVISYKHRRGHERTYSRFSLGPGPVRRNSKPDQER